MTEPTPRAPAPLTGARPDPVAIGRRNRRLALILVAIVVLGYFGIQLRWG